MLACIMICVVASGISVSSRNCTLREVTRLKTKELKSWYLLRVANRFNEPKLPYAEFLRDRLFDNLRCGQPAVDITKAIVNGQDAPEKAWPWTVYIEVEHGDDEFFCGGSLISKSWVLTAAHCTKVKNSKYEFYFGTVSLWYGPGEFRAKSRKVIKHEAYDANYALNDIALIKLDREVPFDDYKIPICLPNLHDEPVNDAFCYATGWGQTNWSDEAYHLQQLQVSIMPPSLCSYSWALVPSPATREHMCIDLLDEKAGTCFGDSGGPIACKIGGRFVLAGIVSSGREELCHDQVFPTKAVRVTEYIDWIIDNVAKNDL